jgi:hypothetical protein
VDLTLIVRPQRGGRKHFSRDMWRGSDVPAEDKPGMWEVRTMGNLSKVTVWVSHAYVYFCLADLAIGEKQKRRR